MLQRYEIARRIKWLAILNFLLAGFIVYTMNSIAMYYFNNEATASNSSEAIYAVRVIANSNREEDQQQKDQIAQTVQQYMERGLYKEPIEITAEQLYKTLSKNYPQITTQISIGQHIIPPKLVDNRLYPQRKQASIIVKLGHGRGDNWFCSVFPHTCEPELDEDEDDMDDEKPERTWLLEKLWRMFQ